MSRLTRFVLLLMLAAAVPLSLPASTIITFETFPGGAAILDSTILTNQFPGVTFTNTIVYNELQTLPAVMPPHSGLNAAMDNNGPISIVFAVPIASFSGYFTYSQPLTIDGFDATSKLVATQSSTFNSNLSVGGDAGSSPNELLSVGFPGGITTVTISGDPDGTSFAMDDITFTNTVSSDQQTPEPTTLGYSILTTLASVLVIAGKRHHE